MSLCAIGMVGVFWTPPQMKWSRAIVPKVIDTLKPYIYSGISKSSTSTNLKEEKFPALN